MAAASIATSFSGLTVESQGAAAAPVGRQQSVTLAVCTCFLFHPTQRRDRENITTARFLSGYTCRINSVSAPNGCYVQRKSRGKKYDVFYHYLMPLEIILVTI